MRIFSGFLKGGSLPDTQPFNTLAITEDRSPCAQEVALLLRQECRRQDGGGTRFAAMAFADITNNISLSPPTRADVCANCNVSADASREAAGDGANVLLKNCAACLLVKYCSVDCQRDHRSKHKEGVQETRGRAEGRAAVRPGSREARRRLLPDLHAADTLADGGAFGVQRLLHEEGL